MMTWSKQRETIACAGGEAKKWQWWRLHDGALLPATFREKGEEHGVERGDTNPTVVDMKEGAQRLRSIWPEKEDRPKEERRLDSECTVDKTCN